MRASGNMTVLVADDNTLVRDTICAILESEGLSVITTTDGEGALRLAEERRPDAIILDVLMPRLDGLAALLRLKGEESTREIPVMLVSGMGTEEVASIAAAYGAAEFLEKPFRPGELMAAVRRMLRLATASPTA